MVLIAVPHMGDLKTGLAKKLLNFDKDEDVELFFSSAQPVDVNRCRIAKHFVEETEHDWLIMIDSDIIPPENLLELTEYDVPIIGPVVYSARKGIPYPVATTFHDKEKRRKMQITRPDVQDTEEGLLQVDGMGTGCICIRREVLEEMEEPYFEFVKREDGMMELGEDLNFCVKAEENGFDSYMHLDYSAGHLTEINLDVFMETVHLALQTDGDRFNFVNTVGERNSEVQE